MTQPKEFMEKASRGKGPPLLGTPELSGSGTAPGARCHMLQTRGCRCNAGRALPRIGRERSGRVTHSRFFGPQDLEQEIVSSQGRAPAAAVPAFLVFWNLPQVGARGRMEGEEGKGGGKEGGRGEAATRSAPAAPRGRRAVAALPTARQARAASVGTTASRTRPGEAQFHAPPRPSLSARVCHLTWVAFSYRL